MTAALAAGRNFTRTQPMWRAEFRSDSIFDDCGGRRHVIPASASTMCDVESLARPHTSATRFRLCRAPSRQERSQHGPSSAAYASARDESRYLLGSAITDKGRAVPQALHLT